MVALDERTCSFAVAAECCQGIGRGFGTWSVASVAGAVVYLGASSNLAARHLYRTVGFQRVAIRPDYYPRAPDARPRSSGPHAVMDAIRSRAGAPFGRGFMGWRTVGPGRPRCGRQDDGIVTPACNAESAGAGSFPGPVPPRRKSHLGPVAHAHRQCHLQPCTSSATSGSRRRILTGPWLFVGRGAGGPTRRAGRPFVGQPGVSRQHARRHRVRARPRLHRQRREPPARESQPDTGRKLRVRAFPRPPDRTVAPRLIQPWAGLRRCGCWAPTSIASLRGKVHRHKGIPVVVTYHPASCAVSEGQGVGGPGARAPDARATAEVAPAVPT